MEKNMRLFTKEQAAVDLQVSTRTLERYLKNKSITAIKVGRVVRFTKEALSSFKTKQR